MVNPIQFTNPQAYSGGVDFSPLANLGNVYQAAQDRARQQAALAQLGPDLEMNSRALISSGVPGLAQLGLNLQQSALNRQREDTQQAIVNARMAEAEKRAGAHLTIAQDQARRVQEEYDKKAADEAEAAKLLAGSGGRGAAPAPSPFPAPLPGAPAQGVPTPPTMAADETGLPAWASPVAARITSNLVSGEPAAAAGIPREQLAELYRNPITRPLATAYLQKQTDPGTWSYHFDDVNQRVVATNNKTNEVKDVTPGGQTGQAPVTKDQRERDLRFSDAVKRGYNEATANYYALNGKLPKEDLSATELKLVNDAQKQALSGEDVLDNIKRLKELSPTAWSGWGAEKRATVANALLPASMIPQGAIDAKELANTALQNVAGQAKAVFGSRLAVAEVKLLNQMESTPDMSDPERQRIYATIEKIIGRHTKAAYQEAENIRNKTYGKPGGGPDLSPAIAATAAEAPAPAPPPAAPAVAAKPSLGDFMKRARAANPGYTDGEIAAEWKKRYGS